MGFHLRRALVLGLAALPANLATAQDTIDVRIVNHYLAGVNLGIAKVVRNGRDSVYGTLTRQPDGRWKGEVTANVRFGQHWVGGVQVCAAPNPTKDPRYLGSQRLTLTGTPVRGGFNTLSQTITYSLGTADGGVLELAVTPEEPPTMSRSDCITMHPVSRFRLLPLNDARWTQPTPGGYVIGIPQRGVLEYTDGTAETVHDPEDIFKKGRPFEAISWWEIRVERR